ncbi:type I-C CRISPR-associated protein Cas8c/Csd1 [Testudinibacter sp. TR-2022]|uniref:type I-C CRISPR-associated protein Cas8c/Csd1 n=1 Tax=Testudinibacter sp. TR-2022 TaxID=2585029 RepID=UPI00111AF6A3|nr:type I-C CRISPR-associated protein Cas8c/Csd1 [Testudinibacter sp. TR-2022]TNH03949.1 type I-C CRISPR-associated protein Cas8c/Csd1 [Pasteurellaceae bacterium Phil31]TNH09562.1 type I-C CRISPR-associated protein Cas8c/Csd1 [Testudinibacter sp. TR-2022]TNH10080.1 type I-C CRISPR-associated protein Cas8c/Csd1 [Testudinibacter sp. TR-2022]TNH17270.1 type I-C CRISPR-associated protein Cas8c/Csd1 [Testudinibacter sp. TR-2022]TNH17350.1 type I-C CRISPR-associated protein Cas8c/Csd1 [Testudinibact
MSWIQKLYRTYEYVQAKGLEDEDLALPFHMPKAVHLKVVLNDKAELVHAERFESKKQVPIQVTEKSSKRSGSTIAAYALHDSLQYLAKTAEKYLTLEYLSKLAMQKAGAKGGAKWARFLSDSDENKQQFINSEKGKYQNGFSFYENQLSDWVQETDLKEIEIVLQYVQKGSLIEDLLEKKTFSFENNILMSEKDDPFDLTIVWAVEMENDLHSDLWSKKSIQTAWIEHQESKSEKESVKQKDLCYITGEQDYPSEAYPKIIGNAKLVSANDTDGLTFLGRFLTDKQAVVLGNDVSQKAFNILKWLISRQGIKNGEQVTVAWAINGETVPSPLQDNYDHLDADDDLAIVETSDENRPSESSNPKDWSANIGQTAAELIKKKLHGLKAQLNEHEQISLLMLDSATPGRMALTYYQEFLPENYFANLDAWVDDFSWYQRYLYETQDGKKKKMILEIIPPSPKNIAQAVYGRNLSDKLKKQLYARLLPVIAGGRSVPIPKDLVQQSFQTACNPFTRYQNKDGEKEQKEHWQRNIGVACALHRGYWARYHNSSQRRNYSMALDKENHSRDYLYGRLIAQAEKLEWYALYLQNGKKAPTRATNAERYFQQFAHQPYSTWLNLEKSLVPYKNYLTSRGKDFYKQSIGEVMDLFDTEEYKNDGKLSGEFLLGYHCQLMEINRQIAERQATKQKKIEASE